MLTAMRAEIASDPELRTVSGKDNKELKVCDVTLAYQKEPQGGKTFFRAVAWEQAAEQLAAKKKGDVIEFAGNLTYSDYKHPSMDKPRKVLGFTVSAIDESQTLCQKLEEYMGVQRRPNDKPGAVFQPMRGKLLDDPVVNQVSTKDGQTIDACNATVRFWNGKIGVQDALVSVSAYGDEARALGEMKKGDRIQFVGRLDSRPYTNEQMEHNHMELSFNLYSIDKEGKLAANTEKFIREQVGMEKAPLKSRIDGAKDRMAAPEVTAKDAPAKEVAEPVK